MTFRHIQPTYPNLLFFVFTLLIPLAANGNTEEELREKQIGVAMRAIGHEILMCSGDGESRIMPIEQTDGQYIISFEREFGIDPDDIMTITERVITNTEVAIYYLVEVERCETKKVVHSFFGGSAADPSMSPCRGRDLPKDCYCLLITILDDTIPTANSSSENSDSTSIQLQPPAKGISTDSSLLMAAANKNTNLFNAAFLIVPLLVLIGWIGYFVQKKDRPAIDPNLLLVGASRFDKKNSTLSFENKSVELSHKESELLSLLHTSANKPLERQVILHKVWGDEGAYVGRTLDVFISKLRKKLEADDSVKIVNIRGVGYKLVMDVRR